MQESVPTFCFLNFDFVGGLVPFEDYVTVIRLVPELACIPKRVIFKMIKPTITAFYQSRDVLFSKNVESKTGSVLYTGAFHTLGNRVHLNSKSIETNALKLSRSSMSATIGQSSLHFSAESLL